jgi:ankyrin repeat protein
MAAILIAAATAMAADARLVDAVRKQDSQLVRTLLNQHVDVNSRSADGSTALLWAAHWNDVDTARLLIRSGADPNASNGFRMTPLSEACTNGSAALVDLILKAGANPNTPIGTGALPIMTCAKTGNVEAVRALLLAHADVNASELSQNQTALMWAAAERHPAVVQALIEAKADLLAHTKSGFTALHFAAREGDIESARLLLDAGVSVDVRSQGATPLLVATMRGQVPAALFLLDHGADPNIGDAGLTPLHWASATWENGTANPVYGFVEPMAGIPDRQGKLQLVKSLLAHGANPNARMAKPKPSFAGGFTDAAGATPFLLASSVDDLEVMRLLLSAGSDPKLMTTSNTTAVMAAAALSRPVGESAVTEQQAIAAVKFLLDLGVSAGGVTTFNENALFGPAYRGWNTLLELLIEKGAEVNVVSKAGVTPWLAASGLGDRLGGVLYNKEGADILAKHGADTKLGRPCLAQNKCRGL